MDLDRIPIINPKILNSIIFLLLFPYILILSVVYYTGITYQNGNNLFNELILERMQIDDEKGFSGNNRTGEITNNTYESFLKTPESAPKGTMLGTEKNGLTTSSQSRQC